MRIPTSGQGSALLTLLSAIGVLVVSESGFVEPPEPVFALLSLAEDKTRLPCRYVVEAGEKVVQVTWYKELTDGSREPTDGSREQIITAHFSEGHTEFGRYSGRVRFEHGVPTEDSALLIPHTEESDEGSYTCRVTTFPSGNFERSVALTVWVLPISSLEPVALVEGEPYGVAASCRAVGRPAPTLSWDTELPGKPLGRASEGGAVSSHFSLHPLRSMNGQRLDCLVAHPALKQPRRHAHRLLVQYPPDAAISSGVKEWVDGAQNAELTCSSGGNPEPGNVTWTRKGGALPDGVTVIGGKLVFGRPIRMNDSGTYECVTKNTVGAATTEITLDIAGQSRQSEEEGKHNLMLTIVGAAAGGLVLVMVLVILLVNHHHRRKNRKLALELNERTEEMNTLSRTASGRRLNSPDDYALLRVDSRIKSSQASLQDRPIYKGSQSTLGGRWGPGPDVEVDELGRPVLWSDSRDGLRRTEADGEKEERRRRVESYLKNSNMSLDSGLPSSLVPMKPPPDDGLGPREQEPGSPAGEAGTPMEPDWEPHQATPEGEEEGEEGEQGEEGDSSSSSFQISEALTNHFYYSNGVLRPKPHSNAILLHPRGQVI
ncbi:LOW QUALITY PROTEIN: nectin-4 [Gadus macrocephalus]|uniref:LOW QUALITY PROTEIN: nectin-4 n=1 Tax=Gadus macrocephalus TaxID=80720 RepID=UPI0028CB1BFD|nr:LOW QUALITY PROTEIN: nectin-4 [Gadus macrocephalus]